MNRDTICVQGGYTPGNGEPRQIPIIQSTTFKYATSEDMGKLFDLEADGYFYSRLQNPTCDMVAKKICELEGGTAAMLTSSGQAANFFALFNICEAGDHIVTTFFVDPAREIFKGHFPGEPVLPGVYSVECMAQTADILLLSAERYAGKIPLFLGINNVRFLKKILPGDTIEIHAKMASERVEKAIATCSAEVYNHGELAVTGDVTLAMR